MDERVPMRRRDPREAIGDFGEVALGYSRAEAVAEARRVRGADLAAARSACPFDVDLAGMVAALAADDFEAARDIVHRAHVWPGILGRWCQKPCEAAVAGQGPGAPFLSALERAVGDHAPPRAPKIPPVTSGRRVAVIGAGSAGSAAALSLARRGHMVRLYDRLPVPGGMMAAGYPEFRLPLAVVTRETDPRALGVDFVSEIVVDRALVASLLATFDAVVVATGKFQPATLGVPGETLAGVHDALDLLTRVKFGERPSLGDDVLVIGGGNTARDASRVARRLGARARVVYRRRAEDMPVKKSEIPRYLAQQAAEGIDYLFERAPVGLVGQNGHVVAAEFCRTRVDEQGRMRASEDERETIACTSVVVATGESAGLDHLPPDAEIDGGHVRVDAGTFATRVPKLFAVGALAGTRTTMEAFASGFACANAIDASFAATGRLARA